MILFALSVIYDKKHQGKCIPHFGPRFFDLIRNNRLLTYLGAAE
ncbi:hypothetical protein ACF5W4_16005 [Bacillota bacterium Lsc_1132]